MGNEKKITVSCFRKRKQNGEKIVALTAYDAPLAQLEAQCGVEIILVGDSLGMAVLGYTSTIPVTIDQMLHHCAAVRRGAPNAFIVGDMPFMTYHVSEEDALKNAARYLQEAAIDAVKIEGGAEIAPTVRRLVRAGVPVMGHIGLLPQHLLTAGGYRIAGKTEEDAQRLVADAQAMEEAGAFAVVLEGIPAEVSRKITAAVTIPTIGIGAGVHCDGQVQVINDLLGLFTSFVPKHARQYANLSAEIGKALNSYVAEVKNGTFPGPENSF